MDVIWWLIGIGVPLLGSIILKKLNDNYWHSHIASAFSVLLFCISLIVLLAAAGLQIWAFLPWIVFPSWVVLYCFAVGLFVSYLRNPARERIESIHERFKTNPLKGWGGATFAEFANGLGVLIPVGVYVAYRTIDGNYWWAAQIAAIVSIISTASWVQRYVLEGPEKEPEVADRNWAWQRRSLGEYVKKTGPNFLGSLSAMLAVQMILIPVESNVNGRENQGGEYWWIVYGLWGFTFFVWCITALWLFRKNPGGWPTWPPRAATWNNIEHLKLFLGLISGSAFLSLVLTVCWGLFSTMEWMDGWSSAFAITVSSLYIAGIIWNWITNGYEEKENKLNLMLLFKDITLLISGIAIFAVQIIVAADSGPWFRDSWFASLYIILLTLMAYAFLIGLLIGAFNWSSKRRFARALQAQPAEQAPEAAQVLRDL